MSQWDETDKRRRNFASPSHPCARSHCFAPLCNSLRPLRKRPGLAQAAASRLLAALEEELKPFEFSIAERPHGRGLDRSLHRCVLEQTACLERAVERLTTGSSDAASTVRRASTIGGPSGS
jgi:hypothetical protein